MSQRMKDHALLFTSNLKSNLKCPQHLTPSSMITILQSRFNQPTIIKPIHNLRYLWSHSCDRIFIEYLNTFSNTLFLPLSEPPAAKTTDSTWGETHFINTTYTVTTMHTDSHCCLLRITERTVIRISFTTRIWSAMVHCGQACQSIINALRTCGVCFAACLSYTYTWLLILKKLCNGN